MPVYNKLVRDNIPEIIQSQGKIAKTRTIKNDEYYNALVAKLGEELEEFCESHELIELADMLEVIEAIAIHKGIVFAELLELKKDKQGERGGFKKGIFLESVIE